MWWHESAPKKAGNSRDDILKSWSSEKLIVISSQKPIKLNSLSAFILNPVTAKQKQDVLNQVSQSPLSLHAPCFSVSTCPNIIHNIVLHSCFCQCVIHRPHCLLNFKGHSQFFFMSAICSVSLKHVECCLTPFLCFDMFCKYTSFYKIVYTFIFIIYIKLCIAIQVQRYYKGIWPITLC